MTSGPDEIISLSISIYPENCVRAAIEAYAEVCRFDMAVEPDVLRVSLRAVGNPVSARTRLIDEFLNYALDLSVRQHLGIARCD